MSIQSINPATNELVSSYEEIEPRELKASIESCHQAQRKWKNTTFEERAALLKATATHLRDQKETYAKLMTAEMGKVVKDGGSEIEKCAWVCDYYAEKAEEFLKDELIESDGQRSYASFQPLGVVLAVMPWNFPFWQVFRFAAPALMAGNGALLKHASNVSGCALAIEAAFKAGGLPEGLFKTLLISTNEVESVISNELVKAVTLTGSTPAGKAVASHAAKYIKKSVLELGGSDPYLVLADADLNLAATTSVKSRLINNGQSCIAAKRFIVVSEVKKEFEKLVCEEMSKYAFGDPLQDGIDLGPMARTDLRDELHQQVVKSMEMGANCLMGGEIPSMPGAYYPPTVLSDVKWGSPAYHEELFGPVASIIEASNEKEAITIANDSFFGLGAAVFTKDLKKGEHIARNELEAGCCFVNDFVKSDPRLPFGGIKGSGYGRELSSFGIREFVNIKTVYVA